MKLQKVDTNKIISAAINRTLFKIYLKRLAEHFTSNGMNKKECLEIIEEIKKEYLCQKKENILKQ